MTTTCARSAYISRNVRRALLPVGPSMAQRTPAIADRAVDREEFPVVVGGMERQPHDAPRAREPELAVRRRLVELAKNGAASPDDKLADAAGADLVPSRVLR